MKAAKKSSPPNNEDQSPPSWIEILPFFSNSTIYLLALVIVFYFQKPFFVIWIFYTLIPLCDYAFPIDAFNIPQSRVHLYEKDKRFLVPLYLFWSIDFVYHIVCLYLFSTGYFT